MSHPYRLTDEADVFSPSLIFYPELIRKNVARVVELVGSPDRLRPHVKTHKTREITKHQLDAGVTKHKCATIAEAEMLADSGVPDVLIAYSLYGPNLRRLVALARKFPGTKFSALIDHPSGPEGLSRAAAEAGRPFGFLLDLDVGLHRSGVPVGDAAVSLYESAAKLPGLTPEGLHAYDGHNNMEPRADREAAVRGVLAQIQEVRAELQRRGLPVPRIVAGGTPTFPIYAAIRDVPGLECSPGTYVLHDHGYGSKYPDFSGITPAAVILTRVISRPTANRITFDAGNKAVGSDPVMTKRIHLLDVPDYQIVGHNEEHLVVETPAADRFKPGDVVYALPGHVCPTVAQYREALTAEGGRIIGKWTIASRDRVLTV